MITQEHLQHGAHSRKVKGDVYANGRNGFGHLPQIAIRLLPEVHKTIATLAAKRGVSFATICRELISRSLA